MGAGEGGFFFKKNEPFLEFTGILTFFLTSFVQDCRMQRPDKITFVRLVEKKKILL